MIAAESVEWVLVVEKEVSYLSTGNARVSLSDLAIVDLPYLGICEPSLRLVRGQRHHPYGLYFFTPESPVLDLTYSTQAKGYPDLATRSFLRLLTVGLSRVDPPVPICCLVDFDPDGIAIMSNYKYGSQALSHENSGLNVASLRWLGVKSSDIRQDMTEGDGKEQRLCLSKRDRKKAIKMLESSQVVSESGLEQSWRRELQVMLMLGVKAEMEALSKRDNGLVDWVEYELVGEVERLRYE